jgi:uncharacterized protein (UPF0332 family)
MIRPEDFLDQAEHWISLPAEVDWRSAVSRAYYAAFHGARQIFLDLGFRPPHGPQAHGYLWMRLSNCGDPILRVTGADRNELSRFRNRVDYDIGLDIDPNDAASAVLMARRILQQIPAGLVEPVRSQIITAIRDYERNVLHAVTWQGP